jgi:hypothetical protein
MSVYQHRNSPFWQFDFQLKGYRFSGSTEVPVTRPKREAETIEATERWAAERIVAAIREEGRKPMTFAAAADRWWAEVGQHGREADLPTAIAWLKGQFGDKPLHLIGNVDVAVAIEARRQHRIPAGRGKDGTQLTRAIGPRTVNRTVTLLMRRIVKRAQKNWDAVIFREPNWRDHLLAEAKRPIREISIAEEEAIEAVEGSYHAIRRLTVIMGLRKREALLTWPQVDFENRLVRIIGKGGIPRSIPMTREIYEILWAERGRHPTWVFTFVAQKTRTCPKTERKYVKGERYPVTYWGLSSHRRRTWPKAGVKARYALDRQPQSHSTTTRPFGDHDDVTLLRGGHDR